MFAVFTAWVVTARLGTAWVFTACLIFLSAAFGSESTLQRIPKVLIIGIGGLRADALNATDTPVLDSLMQAGVHSLQVQTDSNSRGGSGWTTLLTGVQSDFHRVRMDRNLEEKRVLYPNLFDHLKNGYPQPRTAAIVEWEPVGRNILYNADTLILPGSDKKVESEALKLIAGINPDALFLHFDLPERVGRFFGFNPKMPFYRWTVRESDERVGRILDAIRDRRAYKNENWLIIVVSVNDDWNRKKDGRFRPDSVRPDQDMFFLVTSPGLKNRDLGSEGSILDLVPTVLYHFSMSHPPHFAFFGHPAQELPERRAQAFVFDGSFILQ